MDPQEAQACSIELKREKNLTATVCKQKKHLVQVLEEPWWVMSLSGRENRVLIH